MVWVCGLWQVSNGAHCLVRKQGEKQQGTCGACEGYRLLGCDAIRCRLRDGTCQKTVICNRKELCPDTAERFLENLTFWKELSHIGTWSINRNLCTEGKFWGFFSPPPPNDKWYSGILNRSSVAFRHIHKAIATSTKALQLRPAVRTQWILRLLPDRYAWKWTWKSPPPSRNLCTLYVPYPCNEEYLNLRNNSNKCTCMKCCTT